MSMKPVLHCCHVNVSFCLFYVIYHNKYMEVLKFLPVLSGSTVTTAWHVLGLRIEETASRYGG
jgi:hypothetical protein